MKTEKLDAFSLEELYALGEKLGLDLPPGLERPFVVEEILEVLEDDSEDRRAITDEALHVDEKKYSNLRFDDIDLAPGVEESLPARYNETSIRAIVRDPSWAFAFWDVSDLDLAALQGEEEGASLFLRVAELDEASQENGSRDPGANGDSHRDYFDIPVTESDLQWYINLPRPGVRFRIDLCARKNGQAGKARVLARSNEVLSPRQSLASSGEEFGESSYELLALSGFEDLHIEDRPEGNPLRILQSGGMRPDGRAD